MMEATGDSTGGQAAMRFRGERILPFAVLMPAVNIVYRAATTAIDRVEYCADYRRRV